MFIFWCLCSAITPRAVLSSCFAPSEPFPPPVLGHTTPDLISFFSELEDSIRETLRASNPPWNTSITSFAIDVTSANETLWHTDYTAPKLGHYADGKFTNVSGNTAFRIASISKVFTVLAILLQEQEGKLSMRDPVTKYLPELRQNDIEAGIRWDSISLESLASQLSGVPREYGQEDLGDSIVARLAGVCQQQEVGLPPLNESDFPTCGMNHETSKTCSRRDIIQGLKRKTPVFAPNYKSTYSNIAFIMLGFVLETVTSKTYQNILSSIILEPLGMKHTSVERPPDCLGVIPAVYNDWAYIAGAYDPTGGLYSTSTDLSIFLRAIIKRELLDEAATNAWFKPRSWSSGLNAAYGMPWEIYRTTELLSDTDRGMTIITKAGHLYGYSSHIILVPEYSIGITILVAGSSPAIQWLENKVLNATAAFAEQAARRQIEERYVGLYLSAEINSSLSLKVEGGSGLVIKSWISNGTDFLLEYTDLLTGDRHSESTAQLVPAGLHTGSSGEIWRATIVPTIRERSSVIAGCMINDVDSLLYGDRSLQEFIFLTDDDGAVAAIHLPALRISLTKSQGAEARPEPARPRISGLLQAYLGSKI